jgi:4-phytase/acid phosphatase
LKHPELGRFFAAGRRNTVRISRRASLQAAKATTKLWILLLSCLVPVASAAQANPGLGQTGDTLQYVVYVTRHGVRSPTAKAEKYTPYAKGAWPAWPVQPGFLTPHGFHLMELFGAFDRLQFAQQGLLPESGCAGAAQVSIYTDSDERTIETGKAIAQGLMPGCALTVLGRPERTRDPLFHPVDGSPLEGSNATPTAALARAAIAGRIGGDPENLTQAYATPIGALDRILATCGTGFADHVTRTSLLAVPETLAAGTGDHLADLKGPLFTASTLSENLLLEYAEGMPASKVGWGCVHGSDIAWLMSLHAAATDYTERTPAVARAQAANLLNTIRLSIEQATGKRPLPGALGKPSDRALFLVGHDTNLENLAGVLNLNWILDGRRDDTPPGSALVFEVWHRPGNDAYSVRTYFTAQTLDQMRNASPLTLSRPPERVPVFLPGCSQADGSCPLPAFLLLLKSAQGAGL